MSQPDLETVVIPTGRIVTKGTAWWYNNGSYSQRYNLECIHNKSLLLGCNKCRDEIDNGNREN